MKTEGIRPKIDFAKGRFPTAHYPPALRKIVEELFDRINADNPRMPDRFHRRISTSHYFALNSGKTIASTTP
jgi:hypothetical protein